MDKGVNTLLLSHELADVDAVSTLYFLSNKFPGDIVLPGEPDRKGKKLVEFLDLDFTISSDVTSLFKDYQQIVVVDTPNPEQLGSVELDKVDKEKIEIIDHHKNSAWERYDVLFEDRTSCAEIVYDMLAPDSLSSMEGTALIAGILTDTSNLRNADSETFKTLADVLEKSGVDINEVRKLIAVETPRSEKIARLKGAQRLTYKKIDGHLLAYTKIGSFESSVSNSLLNLGADIAFTGSQRGDDFLISGRARSDFLKEKVGVGDIFEKIAEEQGGVEGGGHPGAAVLSGQGDVRDFLELCVNKVKKSIEKQDP